MTLSSTDPERFAQKLAERRRDAPSQETSATFASCSALNDPDIVPAQEQAILWDSYRDGPYWDEIYGIFNERDVDTGPSTFVEVPSIDLLCDIHAAEVVPRLRTRDDFLKRFIPLLRETIYNRMEEGVHEDDYVLGVYLMDEYQILSDFLGVTE